jgi:Na+/H+ antiporter NhaA
MASAEASATDGRLRFSERTAWARNLAAPLRDFLGTETGGAVVLLGATIAALVWANSPWPDSYESVWTTKLSIRLGDAGIALDLRHWVNSGLMTFFFLVVGLEAKRELDVGQLREPRRVALPFFAAVGGMAMAVGIYLAFNAGGSGAHGWGAAMSTDTAFMLGALALVARGGTRLRVRALTISVFDDLIALIVIATAYSSHIDGVALVVAIALFGLLLGLRFAPYTVRLQAAAVVGVAFWVALYESGIDPVIAGLAVGLVTSAYPAPREKLERVVELTRSFREQPTPEAARTAQRGVALAVSPNERLQYRLHPWTSFVIVPLFALANAGIHVDGVLLKDAMSSPITLGILVGYVVGKPVGILLGVWLGLRLPFQLRRALSWPVIAAGGVVAGIGFTVSLLIASLAFHGRELEEAKLGVLATTIVGFVGGWVAFRLVAHLPKALRARQIADTTEDLLDLSDDVDPERDHIRGAEDAPVTLVEYGDYECPYCGQAEVVVRELLSSFGDDLRYVWRHLPLSDVHPNAQMAAEAAEAAAAQGAFWEMHDKLLQHQDELAPRDIRRYAEEIGLDVDRFADEMHRHEYAGRVSDDVDSADASAVTGTPSFFVNGRRHQGAYDASTLTAAVRAARARATALARQAAAAGAGG